MWVWLAGKKKGFGHPGILCKKRMGVNAAFFIFQFLKIQILKKYSKKKLPGFHDVKFTILSYF